MNTPEKKGKALAHDMIALAESHYTLNDELMIALNGMMGAFLYLEEHIHSDVYANDQKAGLAIHNAFARVCYPYMRECIKKSAQLDDAAKERLLEQNQSMLEMYFPEGIVL